MVVCVEDSRPRAEKGSAEAAGDGNGTVYDDLCWVDGCGVALWEAGAEVNGAKGGRLDEWLLPMVAALSSLVMDERSEGPGMSDNSNRSSG